MNYLPRLKEQVQRNRNRERGQPQLFFVPYTHCLPKVATGEASSTGLGAGLLGWSLTLLTKQGASVGKQAGGGPEDEGLCNFLST